MTFLSWRVILASCKVILTSCKVILASRKVMLASRKVMLASCKVMLASCKVMLASCKVMPASWKVILASWKAMPAFVEDDAPLVEDDAPLVEGDARLVEGDARLVEEGSTRWPAPGTLDMGTMSWTKDDQTRLNRLRDQELAGTLTAAEQAELGALMARVEAEEAVALAPEVARLRAEVASVTDQLDRTEHENEDLARLWAQQQALVADARRFLEEFDRRRASILDGLARIAGNPLPTG